MQGNSETERGRARYRATERRRGTEAQKDRETQRENRRREGGREGGREGNRGETFAHSHKPYASEQRRKIRLFAQTICI